MTGFLNSKQATKAHRLLMSIGELRELAGDGVPAPELPTAILDVLLNEVLDLFEEASGFHFYQLDELSDRLEHLEAEVSKARTELGSLRKKAAKE